MLVNTATVGLWFALLFVVLFFVTACAVSTPESGGNAVLPREQSALGLRATVVRVVDGDTIVVEIGTTTETVRLLGIDTPEKAGGPRPAECFGAEASAYAATLLPPDTHVWLSRDQETRDQYSRLLGYVHRVEDSLFINHAMIASGSATALFFAPNTAFEADFRAAADTARREWRGFWPACGAPNVALHPD